MNYMKKLIANKLKFVTLIFLYFIVGNAYGIDPSISAKYPFALANDDHDILTEAELADTSHGTGTIWKCYRTDNVTITYRVMEYSKEHGEDVANFNIYVIDENGIVNQYGMRRGMGVSYCKETSKIWKKLMANQEYVCINGDNVGTANELYNGKTQQVIGWVFNKFKTKNGCVNFFASRDCTGKEIPVVFK